MTKILLIFGLTKLMFTDGQIAYEATQKQGKCDSKVSFTSFICFSGLVHVVDNDEATVVYMNAFFCSFRLCKYILLDI